METPLLPGKAEIRAANLRALIENPAYQDVLQALITEGVARAKSTICKATSVEELFKAAGELTALERIQQSIDALIELGTRKKEQRLTKLAQENERNERRS